jgi:ligand-binding sensor domain-containing protein/signal transduction histidine kinase
VYSINQTPDGYLWIGTEQGLVRFDGITFRLIQVADPPSSSLNHVLGLAVDRDGSLWLRLLHPAILRYRDGAFEPVMEQLGRPDADVDAMAKAQDGSVLLWDWEGQGSAIVSHGARFAQVATPFGLSGSPVQAMAQTSNGDIWLGTRDEGLFHLENGRKSAVRDGLPDLKVNALVPARDNELWVGTDSGVVRWDGAKLTRNGIPPLLNHVQALAMTLDRDSNLWVGTNSHGVLRVNAQGAASLGPQNGPPREAVTAVFEDREGSIWIGSANGLERLHDSRFVTYSLPEGLPSDGSNPVFVDSDERVWFPPVTGGLWWFKDGQHGHVVNDGLDRDIVYSLAGSGDELWAGRQQGGLTSLRWRDGGITAKTYTRADGLAQNSVFSVYAARDGTVWAGTLSAGVSRWSHGRFTNYTAANGLASNTVNSILESSDGTMWFATPAGLNALKNSRWKTYTTPDGLPSNEINCLLEDATGILWVGTSAGLAFGSAGRFQVPNGPFQEPVLGLAADRYGTLWMATANRVLSVSRDSLLRLAPGEGDIREYGLADGLRGVEGVLRHRSVITDPSGRIWFSLNRGISVVDPARLKRDTTPVVVQVQSISVDRVPVGVKAHVHVRGGSQRITFAYTAVTLSAPERVRFRYQLDGFDHGWGEPTAAREAVYTNLPPGRYRFRVIATNPDGVWNHDEAAIAFQVDPLYWQTWWFGASVVAVLLLASLALYRFRLHQLTRRLNLRFEERLAERTRIAQELHDTLLQGFLSASMQVHVMADRLPADSPAKPNLKRALELMAQVIEEGRNAVRGLRSSHGASFDLEHAFAQIPAEFAVHESTLKIGFRVIVQGDRRPLRLLLRDEVYRIGREALVNAFRHARARNIEVEIEYSSRDLSLFVRDDGCGIDPQMLKSGREGHWGLSGMRERADRIGARLHVRSRTAAGTEVELRVPGRVAFRDQRIDRAASLVERMRSRTRGATEKAEAQRSGGAMK